MYVIVEINGQQFKAEQGKKLFVHHIQNAESGAVVEFDKVLLVDNNGEVTVGVISAGKRWQGAGIPQEEKKRLP